MDPDRTHFDKIRGDESSSSASSSAAFGGIVQGYFPRDRYKGSISAPLSCSPPSSLVAAASARPSSRGSPREAGGSAASSSAARSRRTMADGSNGACDGEVVGRSEVASLFQEVGEGDLALTAASRRRRLDEASEALVGRLIRFVEAAGGRRGREALRGGRGGGALKKRGLTLPASAVGWLSSEIFSDGENDGGKLSTADSSPRMKERLAKLRTCLPRSVEYLKVTNEEWPPPPPPSEQQGQGGGGPSALKDRRRRRGSNIPSGDRSVTSTTSIFSLSFPRGVLAYYYPENKTERVQPDSPLEGTVILGGPGITSSNQERESETFLCYWHQIRYNPRINMELFLCVSVLILDGVPPGWVSNLKLVRKGIKLMRIERGSLWDVNRFLFPEDEESDVLEKNSDSRESVAETIAVGSDRSSKGFFDGEGVFVSIPKRISPLDKNGTAEDRNDDDLDAEGYPEQCYTLLSHLKLSHCVIGEISGLSGVSSNDDQEFQSRIDEKICKRKRPRPPPLSRMPNLESLCLSHNEIVQVSTACAGLASLPKLSALDLSHNYLSSMSDAFIMLGNIRTLILSGNRITSAHGLDRMYSLERLSLDDNRIEKLQDITGLANLPELAFLDLKGNPFERESPDKCRIHVLNLFRETRFVFLPNNATYRQLLELLPVLDGETTTNRELLALKDLTFLPSINPIDEPLSVNANTEQHSLEENGLEHPSWVEHSERDGTAGSDTITTHEPKPNQPFLVANMPAGSKRHIIKCAPTRMANIREMVRSDKKRRKEKNTRRRKKFEKQKKSSFSKARGGETDSTLSAPSLDDDVVSLTSLTIKEVIATLIPRVQCNEDPGSRDDPNTDNEVPSPMTENDSHTLVSNEKVSPVEEHVEENAMVPVVSNTDDGNSIKSASIDGASVVVKDEIPDDANSGSNTAGGSLSAGIPGIAEVRHEDESNRKSDTEDEVESKGESEFSLTNELEEASSLPNSPFKGSETSTVDSNEETDLKQASLADVKFPDVWDDIDVPSSLPPGQSTADRKDNSALPTQRYDFGLAERTDSYDGPEVYGALPIATHLDLYFQTFVFPRSSDDDDFVSFEESPSENVCSNFPRIQLFKSDRDMMMSELPAASNGNAGMMYDEQPSITKEKLVDVWKEDVLACGVPAMSRLPSNQIPQRGFHGELVVLPGEEAHLTESKRRVLCLSSEALYIIPDVQATDEIKGTETQERRFPAPIPRGARFEDAFWPHAVVRHPLRCLKRITIGFQFQRLIIHFSLPSSKVEDRKTHDFVYIIFTCNKIRSISLLQKLQEQHQDKATESNVHEESILIDNDDRTILDAMGFLNAPSFIGTVLHYQILLQKWKHGEREAVRRACILTDAKIFLLDETYVGDGSSLSRFQKGKCGDAVLGSVDSADLMQVSEIRAADEDPRVITLVIKAPSRLQRSHRWRLVCKDGQNAERLIDDVRKAKRFM